jgi:prepilin-type N-terminal cleavage/methylation domain-containing protein
MSDRSKTRERGFSLLEMIVAMALGSVVLGAAVQIYSQGVSATWTVTQRAELQQDFRAASNMLTRDLSLAGAGLTPPGAAIQLPTSATLPVYGCAQVSGTPCYLGTGNATSVSYPVQGATPYLYGLLPGYDAGPTLNSLSTDVVTVVYTDSAFYLDCYTATVASATTVTFTNPLQSNPNCTANGSTIQNVNDSAVGLTAGDLVLFTFGTSSVVAEVNGAATTSTTATFASGDVLKMNQASSSPKSLASIAAATTGTGTRLLVTTYYVDKTVSPSRLMRQVSGHTPMPVAENVVYMKFTYDLYNDGSDPPAPAVGCQNPGAAGDVCVAGSSSGLLPNQITKINIAHMSMNGTLKGSLFGLGNGYQGLDLETSVSARDLTYNNEYPLGP